MIYYCCCGLSVMIAEVHWYSKSHDEGMIGSTPRGRSHRGADPIARPAAARPAVKVAGSVELAFARLEPTDSHREAGHENWNRWELPLESTRLWPVYAAAIWMRLPISARPIDFMVFIDRPSAENVWVPPAFLRVIVAVREAPSKAASAQGGGAGATCSRWGWPSPGRASISCTFRPRTASSRSGMSRSWW